ncbi:MAG: hypothetical protein ACOVKC_00290 [Brevundimonas sp.]
MSAAYDWVIEELDGPEADADIVDVNHAPNYAGALAFASGLQFHRIGLVRDSERRGDAFRSWAYVENGVLGEWLLDAFGAETVRVPDRYRAQFVKASA